MSNDAGEILEFWFGEVSEDGLQPGPGRAQRWFMGGPEFDREVTERFSATLRRAMAGELDDWTQDARGRLALVIVLDQFSRNIHRDTPRAFAADTLALAIALEGIRLGHDRELPPICATFLYMPLMHAEDVEVQRLCVQTFAAHAERNAGHSMFATAVEHARKHARIVERFGRYPHRNEVLGRPSTEAEIAALTSGDYEF